MENLLNINLLEEMNSFKNDYGDKYINNNLNNLEYRAKSEKSDLVRSGFQRDRDRIIHSRAFRRLNGKTQVFDSNKGDHYRTRLTHSLEVNQIGRTIAKLLGLNEDLVEAIALGHDLGHTPFGHVIERTLHDIVKNNEIEELKINIPGGFKHNYQSLHTVDNIEMGHRLERGLNLTLAVRDGIIKHTGSEIRSGKTGEKERVYYDDIHLGLNNICLMDYKHAVTLEGQIAALADEIAQSTHDLEDGVRSKIIKIDDLWRNFNNKAQDIREDIKDNNNQKKQFEHIYNHFKEIYLNNKKNKNSTLATNALISNLINLFVRDAVINSKNNILKFTENKNNIFNSQGLVTELFIDNSKPVKDFRMFISDYIYKKVVSSQEVSQSDSKAKYLIKQIFKAYYEDPRQLPDYTLDRYFSKIGKSLDRTILISDKSKLQGDTAFIRLICDHIAGMTDSFAMEEYSNLYGINYNF